MPRKMRTLYLHCETTGRFLYRVQVTSPHQPHLARLAWINSEDGHDARSWCRLVKPRAEWVFEPDAIAGHGITRERAEERGQGLTGVMTALVSELETVDRVVGFNVDFVRKVLERSAYEVGLNHELLFSETPLVCAMRAATDIVRKPRMEPGGGYLWPKFKEAYEFFSGEPELPSLDLDPEVRGLALVACVRVIHQGIMDTLRSAPHE